MKLRVKGRAIALILVLTLLLTGCTIGESGKYKYYVDSLITVSYLGITDEYTKTTGAGKTEAEAIYLQNVSRLADNLIAYYDFNITPDHELYPKMQEVAKKIYSKAKYEVGNAHNEGSGFYTDVTIYPIDILNQTAPEVEAYINDFNERIKAGEYNDYAQDAYESEFASGIMDILFNACDYMEYKAPVTLSVKILTNDSSFYIDDSDITAIDAAIIATTK